jgi:transposase
VSPLGRSWAPRGCTPVVRTSLNHRQRINAIGALVLSPRDRRIRLHTRLHDCNLSSMQIIEFLCSLLQKESGEIVLVWDNAPIHSRKKIALFLAEHPRLHVYEFPAYAPELNPVEYVWTEIHRALTNTGSQSLAELRLSLNRALRRIRCLSRLMRACIKASGLRF